MKQLVYTAATDRRAPGDTIEALARTGPERVHLDGNQKLIRIARWLPLLPTVIV